MKNHMTDCLFVTLVVLMAGGCAANDPAVADGSRADQDGSEAAASARQEPAESDDQTRAGNFRSAGNLQPVDYEGLQRFIESHKGRPLVLDVWSTSCEPCVRELPNLARLQEDYRDRGVVCATLNIDYTGAVSTTPDDAQDAARSVLEALGVSAENLYSTVPDRELFKKELFQENGLYAPPAILVFDRSGEVASSHGEAADGESPYNEVRRTLDSLLTGT